jgi:8-oxo-dGTP pyrophosphatase MutT (NUDIX family)
MAIPEYVKGLRAKIGHDLLLVPGVCGIVIDAEGRVLLHRRSDTGAWAVIGGIPEPGEEPADAVVREVGEETGVDVVPERIVGVYTTPAVVLPNGDRVQSVVTVFRCRPVGGHPHVNDDESLEVRYFRPDELPPLRPDHRLRVQHALGGGTAYFAPPRSRPE